MLLEKDKSWVHQQIDEAIHALADVFKQKIQEMSQRIENLESEVATLKQPQFPIASPIGVNAKPFSDDLRCPLASGVTMALGIRNSTDKSLPIAFCAGSRAIACDNLAFSSEILIASKHTRFGESRFNEAISRAAQSLHQYREAEAARIQRWQATGLSPDTADALLLRAYERQVITTPLLPCVIREWRQPSFEEFRHRTLCSLFNAFITVLAGRKGSNPQRFAVLTIRLHRPPSRADLLYGRWPAPDGRLRGAAPRQHRYPTGRGRSLPDRHWPAWLLTRAERDRRLIDQMALNERTQDLARRFGISPSRVSQFRREFHDDWLSFLGEYPAAGPADASA